VLKQNWWFNVARSAGSVGHVLLDGAGSIIDASDPATTDPNNRNIRTNIGEDGTGDMTVSHGALFRQHRALRWPQ
jgi:T5SS/PEP-CTERM-associated repeat protein